MTDFWRPEAHALHGLWVVTHRSRRAVCRVQGCQRCILQFKIPGLHQHAVRGNLRDRSSWSYAALLHPGLCIIKGFVDPAAAACGCSAFISLRSSRSICRGQ